MDKELGEKLGQGGNLDICFVSFKSTGEEGEETKGRPGKGKERKEGFVLCWTVEEQLTTTQGERDREGRLPYLVSLSFGREEQLRVTSFTQVAIPDVPVRSTHWSMVAVGGHSGQCAPK